MHHLTWLSYWMATTLVLSASWAFTIDVTSPLIYPTLQREIFANKAQQCAAGNKWNGTSPFYSDLNRTHECLVIPNIPFMSTSMPVRRFGLSTAEDAICLEFTNNSTSPPHRYLNDTCYKMAPEQKISPLTITPASQRCQQKAVDFVFLFDGSKSMTTEEFDQMKGIIVEIMNNFTNTSVKFAAVQFSTNYSVVFNFNDFKRGSALTQLMREPAMFGLTNTYKALNFVLRELFENLDSGASQDTVKVLLLITDGDPSDSDRKGTIEKYEIKNITRFVIAVKPSLRLRHIPSQPQEQHIFGVENYKKLNSRICNIEGSKLMTEVVHIGSSPVFYKVKGPGPHHECSENLNSLCYKIKEPAQTVSQGCTKKAVDVVFLIDGSTSLSKDHFQLNKDFVMDMMSTLANQSIKFAAAQFSTMAKKVFDFNDYKAGVGLDKLKEEQQLEGLTNTHKALKFVLDELFENPDAGACNNATKVLVLFTDGEYSDCDREEILKMYKVKKITLLVIGIMNSVSINVHKLREIASEPKDENVFAIDGNDELGSIQKQLTDKICAATDTSANNIENEMSWERFSLAFYQDSVILGSGGSNSWRGCIRKHCAGMRTHAEEEAHMQMDFYLGHATTTGLKNAVPLYFVGTPTLEQTGQVHLLKHDSENWTEIQRLSGEQAGCYFGAELCSLDINSDGDIDFLLVGAPLFYQPHQNIEGKVYIYRLTDKVELDSVQTVTSTSMGQFGTTISYLADLNGDGLRDVAVGAPLEDDSRGAVYIYLGDKQSGVRSTFSQKIMAQEVQPDLRFFGQAIDGNKEENKPSEIVVRSEFSTIVLRSRPVVNVEANFSSQPMWINTDEHLLTSELRICFKIPGTETSSLITVSPGLTISYTLTIDQQNERSQGFFGSTTKKTRNFTSTLVLRNKFTCVQREVYMLENGADTPSHVSVSLNFHQVDTEGAPVVLNVDSKRHVLIQVSTEGHTASSRRSQTD